MPVATWLDEMNAPEFLTCEHSGEAALHAILMTASNAVPGCCAATASVWRHGTLRMVTVSQPELADVFAAQLASGTGPEACARTAGAAVRIGRCADADVPVEFRTVAVAHGIRSAMALILNEGGVSAIMGLYGTQPHVFDEVPALPMLQRLVAQIPAVVELLQQQSRTEREAFGLRRAMATRPVIEQAKGMIMQALGCDDEAARVALQHASQRTNIKVSDIAHRLVHEHPASWQAWLSSIAEE